MKGKKILQTRSLLLKTNPHFGGSSLGTAWREKRTSRIWRVASPPGLCAAQAEVRAGWGEGCVL